MNDAPTPTFRLQELFGSRGWGKNAAMMDARALQAAASRHLAGEASRYSGHASPLSPDQMLDRYRRQNGHTRLTPAQRRRWARKARKLV